MSKIQSAKIAIAHCNDLREEHIVTVFSQEQIRKFQEARYEILRYIKGNYSKLPETSCREFKFS